MDFEEYYVMFTLIHMYMYIAKIFITQLIIKGSNGNRVLCILSSHGVNIVWLSLSRECVQEV